ncbi:MAG: FAD-dependent oxidoreductase [Verrucomicrobia bacterium]|nr:FAD-dependent oxidoreductase [Verrucomicrobiota bacterium]MDE3047534.1 FAD-binding oxidoreductase [Verrucomicrobiota bacterium]
MRIAIVGAGYAGLAAAWHLRKKHAITVFDGGVGASHVSTGLLHPAPGRKALPTWKAQEGMESALELLEAAGRHTHLRNGIVRFLSGQRQMIPEGVTVFSKLYLAGLKKACSGVVYVQHWVSRLEELADFDQIVLTTGAETLSWASLPLKKTIGQCLVCRCDEPIPVSLLGQGHITPTEEEGICLVGSTYEHTERPDPQKALQLIDQVAQFYPPAKTFRVLDILSGTRISPKVGYKPLMQKIDATTWALTGFGSRGLIYHALFGKWLASCLPI